MYFPLEELFCLFFLFTSPFEIEKEEDGNVMMTTRSSRAFISHHFLVTRNRSYNTQKILFLILGAAAADDDAMTPESLLVGGNQNDFHRRENRTLNTSLDTDDHDTNVKRKKKQLDGL